MSSRDHINQIVVVPGAGPFAGIVRWATDGPMAHAAWVGPDGIYEASTSEGIILTPFDEFDAEYGSDDAYVYSAFDVSTLDIDAALTFAKSQLGKPYDWVDDIVIGLAEIAQHYGNYGLVPTPLLNHIERALEDDRRWNCSAFVVAICLHLGVDIFSTKMPTHAVSPNDIYRQMRRGKIPSTLSPRALAIARAAN